MSAVITRVGGYRTPVWTLVVRRVGVEIPELIGVVRRTILWNPEPPDGEEVVPQHVRHGHATDRGAEQIRPLHHDGADEQPTVASAFDREARRAGVALPDQELRRRDEIVEHVLFPLEHSRSMPGLAVLAAAAKVRQRKHAAAIQPFEESPDRRRASD